MNGALGICETILKGLPGRKKIKKAEKILKDIRAKNISWQKMLSTQSTNSVSNIKKTTQDTYT